MPKMSHWNSPDVIDVRGEKAAVYAAQGWVVVGKTAKPIAREAVPAVSKHSAALPKKAPAKAAAKKAAKKS